MFQIDKYGRTPIYEQIIEQSERLIASGSLKPDDQLPSVRSLSQTLSINPNTLQKAYAELERRGISYSVPGNGRFVSKDAAIIVGGRMQEMIDEIELLSEKLCTANVPIEQVIGAVEAAFGKGVKA
ncbi:MAG: GntR family transcriptional regulator [Clostridia bacterium]